VAANDVHKHLSALVVQGKRLDPDEFVKLMTCGKAEKESVEADVYQYVDGQGQVVGEQVVQKPVLRQFKPPSQLMKAAAVSVASSNGSKCKNEIFIFMLSESAFKKNKKENSH